MVADIHTCSYQCDNPPCIKRQRDELLARIDTLTADAERWRFVRSAGKLPVRCTAGYYYEDGVLHPTPEAAIDAARTDKPGQQGEG